MKELLYKIAITNIPQIGAVSAKNLISYCGGVEAVFHSNENTLSKIPGIGKVSIRNILEQNVLAQAEKELEFIEKNQIRPMFFMDDDYPSRIKHQYNCPVMLYYKGNADLNHHRIVGIVGTRQPTFNGKDNCEALVEGLKDFKVLTISGLAYGIDIIAHKKSLECGMNTIGVVGHGLGMIYPREHAQIASEMTTNGGLLTEYTSNIGVEREHFPARNRIIAGMCDALVVVESAKSGGSIITAKFANNYNKDVFSFPGRITDKYSQGCNALIKQNKSHLIESAADIGYIMGWEREKIKNPQKKLFVELDPQEKNVLNHLNKNEDKHIDKLTQEVNISNSEMANLLLNLEFKGVIRVLPGKRYALA